MSLETFPQHLKNVCGLFDLSINFGMALGNCSLWNALVQVWGGPLETPA